MFGPFQLNFHARIHRVCIKIILLMDCAALLCYFACKTDLCRASHSVSKICRLSQRLRKCQRLSVITDQCIRGRLDSGQNASSDLLKDVCTDSSEQSQQLWLRYGHCILVESTAHFSPQFPALVTTWHGNSRETQAIA